MSQNKQSLREIFNVAVEIADARQRNDYLNEICGGDLEMRRQVEALLEADGDAGKFLGGITQDSTKPLPNFASAAADRVSTDEAVLQRFGDYQLLEEIARGGMGIVYKARQVGLDRIVAVKLLLLGHHASQEVIHRFRIEASAAASLQHTNIVAIHEVGVHQGLHYFAMDFVEGKNLAQIVRDGPLSPKRAAGYVKTIAEAIHFAHSRSILHRDLKPSNVLIDTNDRPRVTDFGLAKNLANDSNLTVSGQIIGSPSFMPPEQAMGKRGKMVPASDVYSLGGILYHALTGRAPFVGQTAGDTLLQVQHKEPIAPRVLVPQVPVDLETICLKCLEKDPGKRFASAEELADELGRFLRDEPIRARPASKVEKSWRWCRRQPVLAAMIGALFLALASSLWLLVEVSREKDKQVALVEQVKDSDRENNALLKRTLGMIEENLDGIWGNRDKRVIVLESEEIAALAQIPLVPITNKTALVRWRMGLVVEERPAGRVRQYAKLLSELEKGASKRLGRQVRIGLRLFKFQEDFMADLSAEKFDFGRMGALHYLRNRRNNPALQPLVMPTTSYKTGVLFTRPGTGIRSIRDLEGRIFAFGDTNSTISYWAQIKMAEKGITATNLAKYDFLNSTLDFAEEVQDVGFDKALQQIGYLHSHAQVIEGVLSGTYDAGVAMEKAFRIHEHSGLVSIPDTEFVSSRTLIVGRPELNPIFVQTIINVMTNFHGAWLEGLKDQSPGFQAVGTNAFDVEEQWLDRINKLFPPKAAPPSIKVP